MITFRHVSKQFGPHTAIKDVSFEIADGELVVLTGPSGAGKTSLMRLLTREYTADEGEILFDDFEVTDLRGSELPYLRREIGVVFQDYKLLPERTIWENIELSLDIVGTPSDEREDRIFDLLELVGIDDKMDLFPSQLSGGEAQRAAIARALATAPEAIFADEPTGNLDPDTAISITKLLKKINDLGTTVVIATHDMNVLNELGDVRSIEIREGKIVRDADSKIETNIEEKDEPAREETETADDTAAEKETEKEAQEKEKAEDAEATAEESRDHADKEPDETPDTDSTDTAATTTSSGPRISLGDIFSPLKKLFSFNRAKDTAADVAADRDAADKDDREDPATDEDSDEHRGSSNSNDSNDSKDSKDSKNSKDSSKTKTVPKEPKTA